jgi:protein phosphatase
MKTEYFESADVTDLGRKRTNNEDACLRIPERGIYCVADGMGGQAGGELASEAIIRSLQKAFTEAGPDEDNTLSKRVALFRRAINQASKWIKDFSDEKVIGQMGSTVVGFVIDPLNPARAVGLHAGDSRLYRYRAGELKQLTADHSAVAALAAKLGCDPATIPAKYQNELLRCVGVTESVELERTPVDILSGDLFLVCSDGLTRMVPDAALAGFLGQGAANPIEGAAQALVDAANSAGGKDNITVVLVRVGDISGAPNVIDPNETDDTSGPEAAAAALVGDDPTPSTPSGGSGMPDTGEAYTGVTPQTDDPTPERTPNLGDPRTPNPDASAAARPKPRRSGRRGKRKTLGFVIVGGLVLAGGAWSWIASGRKTPEPAAVAAAPVVRPVRAPVSDTPALIVPFSASAPAPTPVAESPNPGGPVIIVPFSRPAEPPASDSQKQPAPQGP